MKIRISVTEVAPALAGELLSAGNVDDVLRCHDTDRYTVSAEFSTRKSAVDWLLRVADVPATGRVVGAGTRADPLRWRADR